MNSEPKVPIDFLISQAEQLVLLSAFLGGFSATFLATILAIDSSKRVIDWIVSLSAISACSFIVATFTAISFINGLHPDNPFNGHGVLTIEKTRAISALALIMGFLALFSSVGLSGWIRSSAVGIVTSTVSLFSIVLVFLFF